MLTFRLLEVFQQVVDCGSVTAASNALQLSQPTVSLQLKKLNSIVGMPLLEHFQGSQHLTEAGIAVYRCAQEILSSKEKLESQLSALRGVEIGSLKLAVVTTAKYIIPPLLSPFCKEHPNIDVRFTVGNRAQIAERLMQNRDDLYIFTYPPQDEELICEPFLANPLVVIAPPDYDGPDNCALSELTERKFLLREYGSGTRRTLDEYCDKRDITFTNTMVIESNEAIRLAVSAGLGLAVLSKHTLAQSSDDQVRILNITDFPIVSTWQVVTNRRRPISVAAQAFRQSILNKPRT
ncbi:LysR family transcriptional regulator [Alteromonas gilva]|uniref:LysR family transcriptional regulator n=1 Tax=Alteromonas gilva TaxID=2987522 RepID=A0ABT5L728_9ALTE|nr:LysR family transcriptional regulator [Alteromonas gilva]MDC8832176.1 LysR family transcriptional regulator [Alteromonas gilva]